MRVSFDDLSSAVACCLAASFSAACSSAAFNKIHFKMLRRTVPSIRGLAAMPVGMSGDFVVVFSDGGVMIGFWECVSEFSFAGLMTSTSLRGDASSSDDDAML